MSSTANVDQQPKVVYISTRYVETDPLSFKSVVQSLTSKESSSTTTTTADSHLVEGPAGAMLAATSPTAFSCGDFSRALLEIPHSEELNSVYGDLLFNSQQQAACWVTTTNL